MSTRLFTRQEVSTRDRKDNAAIIIDNVVYDVSGFLEDHPGGVEVLLNNAGLDASRCFHDVGHSDDARAWREQYRIGEVVPEERREVIASTNSLGSELSADELTWRGLFDVWAPPLMMGIAATLAYIYLF
ncbi:unnamed protein product [Leptosia nina]|uniref:Cytochrome b5 n=1 Tax=Leptosia nina TaxID=320188 RepID=A0AAV1J4B8_9NEOP